jgi:hypothetical protein
MKLHVQHIKREEANRVQRERHYLHKKASCRYAFGLYDGSVLMGVMLYGNPTAPTTIDICGESYRQHVLELTRLWIDDSVPKNGGSFFIGKTLKQLKNRIIVAFADPEYGHIGAIYQSANFLYTGASERVGGVVTIRGDDVHNKTLWKRFGTAKEIREYYGDENVYYKKYIPKLRYVYLTGSKTQKKQMRKALKYPALPYPKGESKRYDAGVAVPTQQLMFA